MGWFLRLRTALVVGGLIVVAFAFAFAVSSAASPKPKHPGAPRHARAAAPTLYVGPSGHDSADCASQATACATFNGAFQKAVGGATIVVGAGTYDARAATIYPNPRLTQRVRFRPRGAVMFVNGVRISASHVQMSGFTFGYTNFLYSDGGISHSYGLTIQPPSGAAGSYSCITDIRIVNASGHAFAVNNGTSGVVFSDSSWGNLGWAPGQRSNLVDSWNAPAIGGSQALHCPDSSRVAPPATDIRFERVRFGANFLGCAAAPGNPANCQYPRSGCVDAQGIPTSNCATPSHADCLHVFGETVGLRIENSVFDGCFGMYLNLNVESGFVVDGVARIKDAVIRNNWFGEDAPSAASTIQLARAGTGPLFTTCDNVRFVNNTFSYEGALALALECPRAPRATVGVRFEGNIFSRFGPATDRTACGARHAADVTWGKNYFEKGVMCGALARRHASRTAQMQNLPAGIGSIIP